MWFPPQTHTCTHTNFKKEIQTRGSSFKLRRAKPGKKRRKIISLTSGETGPSAFFTSHKSFTVVYNSLALQHNTHISLWLWTHLCFKWNKTTIHTARAWRKLLCINICTLCSIRVSQKALPPESNNMPKQCLAVRDWLQHFIHCRAGDFKPISPITNLSIHVDHLEMKPKASCFSICIHELEFDVKDRCALSEWLYTLALNLRFKVSFFF